VGGQVEGRIEVTLEEVDRSNEEKLGDQPGQTDAEAGEDIDQRADGGELQVGLR
jgi:hypothetical protein